MSALNRLKHARFAVAAQRSAVRGVTLIELMVALLIGSVLSLAVFGMMATFEGRRRTLGSTADLQQAGTMAMFQIDRWVRSAGTGFVQSNAYAYGCALYAAKANTQILPRASALDAPFDSVNPGSSGVFRLAPLLILPGQTKPGASNQASDVLVLMSGGAGNGSVGTLFSGAASAAQLSLENTVAFSADDLVLLADQQPSASGGVAPCLLTQAKSETLALGGAWYKDSIDTVSVAGYTDAAVAIDLGNVGKNRPPSFQLVGVGDHNTLYSYDLLQTVDTPLQARAEGVFELHALYGVDTDGDSKVDAWVSPASGDYSLAALSAGTSAAAGLLKNIKAVRVGLILRTSLPEKDVVSSAKLELFSDINSGALTYSRTLTGDEQTYRYRTIEATIPLRNNLL
jgi:type IV pilus assembly protein PilW